MVEEVQEEEVHREGEGDLEVVGRAVLEVAVLAHHGVCQGDLVDLVGLVDQEDQEDQVDRVDDGREVVEEAAAAVLG